MKHILFISHARGMHGAEAVMVQAIKACAEKGVRITVTVSSVGPDEGLEKILACIPDVKILALPFKLAGVHAFRTALVQLFNIPALWRLKAYVKQEKVDVIYSSSSVTTIGVALAHITHVRHVWHWHEPVDTRFDWHPSLAPFYRYWVRRTDTLIGISHQQQKEWAQALSMPLTTMQIIYNPIKPIAQETANIIPHKGIRIGFIGHFEERKNLPLLVHTFEHIHAKEPAMALWLCGALNKQDKQYIAAMTTLQEPDIIVLPQTSEVEAFYHAIDILVLPSWKETMPLVVLEAMQAGVCVLQTDQSGMKERLQDGKETLFFSPNQPEQLLTLLEQCLDTKYRHKIAATGQRKALQLVNQQSFDAQIQTILCE